MSIENIVSQFQFTKVLASDTQTKTVALLGEIKNEYAIITLEKSHFNLDDISSVTSSQIQSVLKLSSNDIYQWGVVSLSSSLPDNPSAKVNIIYPATETHIRKYSQQKFHLVTETPLLYEQVVEPYIESMTGDRLKWVRNILYEGAESERVVYREEGEKGFVLLPDMKWDEQNVDALYLCAIVTRSDIRSLRDLSVSHKPWLEEMNVNIRRIVREKYDLPGDELRLFIHYQPSYYHFHIHVVNIKHPGLGDGIAAGKANLLEDVIEQLNWLGGNGFKSKTISYVLGENHELWKRLQEHL